MLSADAPIRVQMEDISKSFGAIKSLDRVNLVLRAGEVLGLVGDNGAGKSTLSKILSGAVVPDSGRILLDDREVRFVSPADARRQRVEMVYQDLSLCDTVDVAGNLLLGREPLKRMLGVPIMDKRKMHADAEEMLAHLGGRGGRRCARSHRAGKRQRCERHSHHSQASGSVCGLRPYHGPLRGSQRRRAAYWRDKCRGDRQPDCREKIPLDFGRNAARKRAALLTAITAPNALRDRARLMIHDNGGVVSIAAFFVVMTVTFSLITNTFLTQVNLLNILRQTAPLMIVAVAMTFVITTAGIDLSVGSILALVNALAAISLQAGLYLPLVIVLMLGVGIVIGLIQGFFIAYEGIPAFIVTLAGLSSIRGTALLLTKGYSIPIDPQSPFNAIGRGWVFGLPMPAIIAVVALGLGFLVFNETTFGRYVTGVGRTAEAVRRAGVNTKRITLAVYALSGLAAAMAGLIIAARLGSGSSNAGGGFELDVIAAVVLGGTSLFGGRGTMIGTMLGALTVAVIGNGLILCHLSPFLTPIVEGFIILIAIWLNFRLFRTGRRTS